MAMEESDPRAQPASSRFLYLVNRLARAFNRVSENIALARGLSLPEFMIMLVLGEGEPLSNAQLGRRTFVSAQAAHVVVKELAARGLLYLEDHPTNRRVRLARLTDEGWALLEACRDELAEVEDRMLSQLPPEERALLLPGLLHGAEVLAGGYFGDAEAEAAAIARRLPRHR